MPLSRRLADDSNVPQRPAETTAERDTIDLRTRAAWLYFMEGMTQDAVAMRLGVTRQRVLKMLANARADGTVQVRVTGRHSACVALERRLEAAFKLKNCTVVPAPENEANLTGVLGAAIGAWVSNALQDGMTIGLGWGVTLQASLTHIAPRVLRNLTVVSLLGGLTRARGINPAEFAWRFADLFEAESYLLTAPVVTPDVETRDALRRHPGIAEVLVRIARLDIALVSVGNTAPNSTLARYGILTREELGEIRRAGAVADVLCQFIDAAGQVIAHPLNDRILAAHLSDLRSTPQLVLAAGGWEKVEAIRAAIRLLEPKVLITDQVAAEGLLSEPA